MSRRQLDKRLVRHASREPSSHRAWLLSLAVLAVGVAALWFVLHEGKHSQERRPSASPLAHLQNGTPGSKGPGATGTTAGPDVHAKRALSGFVFDELGKPLRGVVVFMIPTGHTGTSRGRAPHVNTNAKGHWRFKPRRVHEKVIGFLKRGYRHNYVECGTIKPDEPLRVSLTKTPSLEIKLVDEHGAPIANQAIGVSPCPALDLYDLPGPEGRRGERWLTSNKKGRAVCHLGTNGPVVITPMLDGFVCHQSTFWLPSPHTAITIRAVASCQLRVNLNVPKDMALPHQATLYWRIAGSKHAQQAITSIVNKGHVLFGPLPKESLDAKLVLAGARSIALPSLDLSDVEHERAIAAAILARPEPGTVTLKVQTSHGKLRHPRVYILKKSSSPESEDTSWVHCPECDHNVEDLELTLCLEPATYRILVVENATKGQPAHVAASDELIVPPGKHVKYTLHLTPGAVHTISAKDFEPGHVKSVIVEVEGMGRLPLYGRYKEHRRRFDAELLTWLNSRHASGVVLGPYPPGVAKVRVKRHRTAK